VSAGPVLGRGRWALPSLLAALACLLAAGRSAGTSPSGRLDSGGAAARGAGEDAAWSAGGNEARSAGAAEPSRTLFGQWRERVLSAGGFAQYWSVVTEEQDAFVFLQDAETGRKYQVHR